MFTQRLVYVLSLLTIGGLGAGGITGCAGSQGLVRTLAPAGGGTIRTIAAQAEQVGCKVTLLDRELPLLIIDCEAGRITFGPDSGQPRSSGVETIKTDRRAATQYLEAACFHGLESRCQEYAERLLGQTVTNPELRVPKGPNPLVRPAGRGWSCFTFYFGGSTKLHSCYRDAAECNSHREGVASRGDKAEPCSAVERASCFTTGRGHGDWECAATPALCEESRNKGASACGLWE